MHLIISLIVNYFFLNGSYKYLSNYSYIIIVITIDLQQDVLKKTRMLKCLLLI